MSGGPPGTGAGWDAGYQPGLLRDLWEAIPPGMRLAYFSADTVPEQYRGGLAHQRGRTAGIDLSPLPAAIRQELAWCVFRIISQGGKVDVTHMRALARRLGEVISDLGAAAPASLTGLAPRDWQQQFALAVRRRTGALPGPGSLSDLRQQLGRCWRLLAAAYDTRPWWQREIWSPAADPRIPQRAYEPRRQSVNFGQITAGWRRRGLQWHCKVGLEPGPWPGARSSCGSPRLVRTRLPQARLLPPVDKGGHFAPGEADLFDTTETRAAFRAVR